MTDPAQIARRLSGNMRSALIFTKVASDGSHWTHWGVTMRTSQALKARGLIDGKLTPLGLAVRAELEKMDGNV